MAKCTCKNFISMAKDRIVVQSQSQTTDDYGGAAVTWSTVGTYWAYIEPLSAREVFESEQNQSKVTHKMYIRYQSALKDTKVTGSYRVSFDGRVFAIDGIKNLREDFKGYGRDFQELRVLDNGPEITG